MNSSYKVSLVNINICYPDLSETEKLVLARDSIVETIVSGYETLQSGQDQSTNLEIGYSKSKIIFYFLKTS